MAQGHLTKRWGITKKALVPQAAALLFMLIVSVIAIRGLMLVNERMTQVTDNLVPTSSLASDLTRAMYRERLAVDAFVSNKTVESVTAWRERNEDVKALLARADQAVQDADQRMAMDQILLMHREFEQVFENDVARPILRVQTLRPEALDPLALETLSNLERAIRDVSSTGDYVAGELASDALKEVLWSRLEMMRYLQNPSIETEQIASARYAGALTALQTLRFSIFGMTAEELQPFENALTAWRSYGDHWTELHQLLTAAVTTTEQQLHVLAPQITDRASAIEAAVARDLSEVSADILATNRSTHFLFTVVLLPGVAFGVLISWMLTRGYVGPLLRTNKFVRDLVEALDSGDANLTQRLVVTTQDEVGELGVNINRFVETLQQVIGTISRETDALARATKTLMTVTAQSTQGAVRQCSETEEVAAAINEMSATIQDIARNASQASVAAEEADQSTRNSRQVVTQTVNAIDSLVAAVRNGQQSVNALGTEAESITEVVDVIQAVAQQINLLALNAAIEAARAGDEGRGFAVVASEIRALAKTTQDSTRKIQQLIETLQTGARSAVTVMQQSGDEGGKTIACATQADSALEQIAHQVEVINVMNAQIATASEEQTAVARGVSVNISKIRTIAEDAAAGALQNTTASDELVNLSERLNTLVHRFRI